MSTDMTLMDGPVIEELSLAELLGIDVEETQNIAELVYSAKNGDSLSMGLLGEKYMKGQDMEKNIPKGLYWLAESDDERSLNEIASFYEKEEDLDRAETWYLKVVDKNGPYSFQGLNSLALLYLRPEKLDIQKAEYYLEQSLEAMENIPDRLKEKEGYMLYQNTLLYGAAGLLGFYYSKIDPVKAVYWLTEEQTKKIEEKPIEQQKILAKALAESYNQLFFLPDAPVEFLDEAAQMLDPIAEKMGPEYIFGLSEYYTNHKEAKEKYFYWKEKAAHLGDVAAQAQLAYAYLGDDYNPEWTGISMDLDKCRQYVAMAKGNVNAQTKTPERYEQWKNRIKEAETCIIKEENKYAKHFTSKEAKELIKAKGADRLVIPEGYTHIDTMAFSGIDKKVLKTCKELILPESLRVIENLAFCETYKLAKIKLPKSLRYLGARCFDNSDYVSKGGISMLLVPYRKSVDRLTIPAYTELEIIREGNEVYTPISSGFYSIEKLFFEEGRTTIDWDHFCDVIIDELYIPDSVQKIHNGITKMKFKVKTVSLPAHLKDQIPNFEDCQKAGCKFKFRGEK